MNDNFKLLNIKGTDDSLPKEQLVNNKVVNTLKEVFELYGFLPIDTPILCYYDLLSSKYAGGSEIMKEVYSLYDQGDRHIGLRYDLTVPFCKVIGLNKGMNLPFRRYEIGKVFRDGPVKLGRAREFYQCDVDVCGIDGQEIEFEFINIYVDVFKRLGIDIYIEWNNRKFLSGIIYESGFKEADVNRVILSVDKLAKIGKDGVKKDLEENNVDTSNLETLFNYFDKDFNIIKEEFKNTTNDILKEGINEIERLNELINNSEAKEYCRYTPYLARGLDIYTGFVIEVFDKEERIASAIGGGGRYDNIVTKFIHDGNNYPAVGVSFGLEAISIILNKKTEETNNIDAYVYSFDKHPAMFKVAKILRDNNLKTIVETKDKKLKKALEYANRENIKYVFILGEEEIQNNSVTIKNMESGEQKTININELVSELPKD